MSENIPVVKIGEIKEFMRGIIDEAERKVLRENRLYSTKFIVESGFGLYEISLIFDRTHVGRYGVGVQGSIVIRLPNNKIIKGRLKAGNITLFLGNYFEEKPTVEELTAFLSDFFKYTYLNLVEIFDNIPNEYGNTFWDIILSFDSDVLERPEWARDMTDIEVKDIREWLRKFW